MKEVTNYLLEKYNPNTIVFYGSFVDGTNSLESDFDGFIVMDNPPAKHDSSFVCGIQLDVFIYDTEKFLGKVSPSDFPMVNDCSIVLDKMGFATKLCEQVRNYINSYRSDFDKDTFGINWCKKMLNRAVRGDAEGYFRWHWVLTDSLEIYCSVRDKFYFGPKKTLAMLEREAFDHHLIYTDALIKYDENSLKRWLNLLFDLYDAKYRL